jgi:hypothetical protein
MGQEKRRQSKIKERERAAKKKIARRAYAKNQLEKEKRVIENKLDAEASLFNKQKPYWRPDKLKDREAELKARDEQIMAQLEHNLQLLEAMEEEYLKEEIERDSLNAELEGQGLLTIEEKVNYLKEKAKREAEEYEEKLAAEQAVRAEAESQK